MIMGYSKTIFPVSQFFADQTEIYVVEHLTDAENLNFIGQNFYEPLNAFEKQCLLNEIAHYLKENTSAGQYSYFYRLASDNAQPEWMLCIVKILKQKPGKKESIICFNYNMELLGDSRMAMYRELERDHLFKKSLQKFLLLTKREKEIIALIATGLNTEGIAENLFISAHTVASHRKKINKKLGTKNTGELMKYAELFDLTVKPA